MRFALVLLALVLLALGVYGLVIGQPLATIYAIVCATIPAGAVAFTD